MRTTHYINENIFLIEVLPTDMNPFKKYIQLKTIWSKESAQLAEEAIDECFDEYIKNKMPYGKIFLIKNKNSVIGITGYLPWNDDGSKIGLRWHGLIPEERGAGLSGEIIEKIRSLAHLNYPDAKQLVEFMPVGPSFETIKSYFSKLGFEVSGKPENVEWSIYPWQEFSCDITKKLQKIENQNLNSQYQQYTS